MSARRKLAEFDAMARIVSGGVAGTLDAMKGHPYYDIALDQYAQWASDRAVTALLRAALAGANRNTTTGQSQIQTGDGI